MAGRADLVPPAAVVAAASVTPPWIGPVKETVQPWVFWSRVLINCSRIISEEQKYFSVRALGFYSSSWLMPQAFAFKELLRYLRSVLSNAADKKRGTRCLYFFTFSIYDFSKDSWIVTRQNIFALHLFVSFVSTPAAVVLLPDNLSSLFFAQTSFLWNVMCVGRSSVKITSVMRTTSAVPLTRK